MPESYRPIISVIVPTYNRSAGIKDLVSCLAKQTQDGSFDYEIIVVNDGSTDTTASAINNVKLSNRNTKIFHHKKNLGKGAAVRTGIAKAISNCTP